MQLFMLAVLFTGFTEVISKPSPLSKSVQALQGDKVTLSCNYSSANNFFWYRQYPSSPPQFLIKEYMEISGFTLKKDEERKVFQLEISSAAVTDSALYYCAVVTTGAQKIVFGSGTSLTVELEVNSQPSYYELSKPNGTNVCLALGFTSWNGTAETGGDVFENMTEASRAPDEAFYSQVAVDRSCPEGSDVSCTDTFHPDEKVNFLSLIMLGLRILVLKAVVFNVLMTLRLWLH